MVRRILLASFMAVILFSPLARAQELVAFVDRTDIAMNEVITLTIRVPSQLGNNKPTLGGLERDFIQLGTSTRNSYTNINGNVQSWTEYSISLTPKAIGSFTIPAFRIGGEMTNPITISVGEAAQNTNTEENDIFLSTTVSKNDVYVQEQLMYTVKLYYSIAFDQGAQLSSPQVENSVVQQLGSDTTYQEIVEGIRFNVTERKFVIFPQASGELTIPPVFFSATVGSRGGISSLLNRNRRIRQIELASETHSITVKGQPAGFPGSTWLPAAEVSIQESWSGDMDSIEVGDSITRNLVIEATGLSSSLLPGIQYEDIPGLKFYPDQPATEDTADSSGITGMRSEGTAIVPSEAGEFEIPALELPWWNTTTDTLEYASIAPRSLNVMPSSSTTQTPDFQPQSSNFGPLPQPGQPPQSAISPSSGLNPALIVTSAVFALAWLFTTMLWLRSRRQLAYAGYQRVVMPAAQRGQPHERNNLPALKESVDQLAIACGENNLKAIRQTVIHWGQAWFENRNILTLEQLRNHCGPGELQNQLLKLERCLYGSNGDAENDFHAGTLLTEVKAVQKRGRGKKSRKEDYSLPPLYKN